MFKPTFSLKPFAALAFGTVLLVGGAMAQKIDKADADLLQDIARANIAEIETGKLAAQKTKDPAVKQYMADMKTTVDKRLKTAQDILAKVYGDSI